MWLCLLEPHVIGPRQQGLTARSAWCRCCAAQPAPHGECVVMWWRRVGDVGEGSQSPKQQISIDIPLDGLGPVTLSSDNVISPVFTLWLTLMLMFIGEACDLLHHSSILIWCFRSHVERCLEQSV